MTADELPPEPGTTSDAGWFHDLILRIRAAQMAGDDAEVDRLRDYARREGDAGLAQMVDQVLAAAADARATARAGDTTAVRSIGVNLSGQRLCDFCASSETVAYYPFEEFHLASIIGTFASGDRMYVCRHCHHLVEANDWRGLRDWVGPAARTEANRLLWLGFRQNRTGPAVFFTPDTDPEQDRPQ